MTRNAGARRASPRLLIALALVLGTAIGVAAFSELPWGGTRATAEHRLDSSPETEELDATTDVAAGGQDTPTTIPVPPPGTAGMRVALDPETGELGLPTDTQRRELSPDLESNLSYSDEGLQVEHRADGSRHVNLEGRFQNHSIAHLREDGSVEIQCVHGDAERHLHECSPATGDVLPEE